MLGFADDFEKNEGIIVGDKDDDDGSLVAVGGAIQQSISDDDFQVHVLVTDCQSVSYLDLDRRLCNFASYHEKTSCEVWNL